MGVITAAPPPALTDEQLLAQFAAGERDALEELFRRHRLIAYRVAYRFLGHEADALDAVQDGFVKTLTRLHLFQGRSSFKTWLLRVVTNTALDLGRQRRRRETYSGVAANDDDDATARLICSDPAVGLEREDLRRLLDRALASLPEGQRRAFVLHADAELNYREIADVMGISIGTVMSRIFYARRKLRVFLSQGNLPV